MTTPALKLSWEFQSLNELENVPEKQKLALEICYGVALAQDDPDFFSWAMEKIQTQVTDFEMQKYLVMYAKRAVQEGGHREL